jgi:hypothetical protein
LIWYSLVVLNCLWQPLRNSNCWAFDDSSEWRYGNLHSYIALEITLLATFHYRDVRIRKESLLGE